MLYLSGSLPRNPVTLELFDSCPHVGLMSTYRSVRNPGNRIFAADNCCFTDLWDESLWKKWLLSLNDKLEKCLFATVPDRVGDHETTRELWDVHSSFVTDAGFVPSFVIQDGATISEVPWDECGSIFIGGTTEFKLSEQAKQFVQHGKSLNKWVHMGRVNSFRRIKLAYEWGCDSVDGTYVAFGPDKNTPRMIGWMNSLDSITLQEPLWQ